MTSHSPQNVFGTIPSNAVIQITTSVTSSPNYDTYLYKYTYLGTYNAVVLYILYYSHADRPHLILYQISVYFPPPRSFDDKFDFLPAAVAFSTIQLNAHGTTSPPSHTRQPSRKHKLCTLFRRPDRLFLFFVFLRPFAVSETTRKTQKVLIITQKIIHFPRISSCSFVLHFEHFIPFRFVCT